MVTKRLSVSSKYVNWYDGQQVTDDELDTEQLRNINIDASTVANFMGSGVVESNVLPKVILDTNSLNSSQQSLLDGYAFDGQNIYIGSDLETVSDSIYGVQLSIELLSVRLDGLATTKVSIIGDSFGDTLIHDDLIFNKNGKQITRGRYKRIRAILLNNFAGNSRGSEKFACLEDIDSYNLIGRCIVKETESMETSYDTIIASQDQQPNQFFNNFIPGNSGYTVTQMLQDAVGSDKSVGDLNISLTSNNQRELAKNDTTTKIGQKFKALGENIQNISLLFSIKYDETDGYNWSGSIVLEIRKLQTEISCPISEVPDNAVDFDPDPAIIAQISLNKSDLEKQGVILDGYSKKVDFVFTEMQISNPTLSPIEKNSYYVFTIGRSGDTHTGVIKLEEASNNYPNGYMTIFDGIQWVNIKDSDMWFKIYGNYIKISDGIAYEDGVGVEVPKIKKNESNIETPYIEGFHSFYTSQYDAYNYILVEKSTELSDIEQDQRTGNQVYSRTASSPSFSVISSSSLITNLNTNPSPVLLARIKDTNPRGNIENITGTTNIIGLVYNNELNVIYPNADLRSFNLVGSILKPNTSNSAQYRIISAELIYDSYGDINGDGYIDINDLDIINSWLPDGYDISNTVDQTKIANGQISVEKILRADVNGDGKVDSTDASLLEQYINKEISTFPVGSTFPRLKITVENLTNPLDTVVSIHTIDSQFTTVPFSNVNWNIEYFSNWIQDNLIIEDLRRKMPTTFTEESSTLYPGGKNNFMVPGNLFIGGNILNPDETSYSIDLEVTNLTLDLPILDGSGNPVFLDGYTGINIFNTFVAESSYGKTSSGFQAMKYNDGTYVQIGDFENNKVKISASLQSTCNEYNSFPVKDLVGLYYDPSSSLATIYYNDGYNDNHGNLLPPLSTKILITVYLKKAGFSNETVNITQEQMLSILKLN